MKPYGDTMILDTEDILYRNKLFCYWKECDKVIRGRIKRASGSGCRPLRGKRTRVYTYSISEVKCYRNVQKHDDDTAVFLKKHGIQRYKDK